MCILRPEESINPSSRDSRRVLNSSLMSLHLMMTPDMLLTGSCQDNVLEDYLHAQQRNELTSHLQIVTLTHNAHN